MKVDEVVFVYDPLQESVYECKIKKIIKGEDGVEFAFVLTPSNSMLPEVTLPKRHVHKLFRDAFLDSIEN